LGVALGLFQIGRTMEQALRLIRGATVFDLRLRGADASVCPTCLGAQFHRRQGWAVVKCQTCEGSGIKCHIPPQTPGAVG
jgi:ribosomal protein L37AE/L43A